MAIHKLDHLTIKARIKQIEQRGYSPDAKPALLGDGQGLYLAISRTGSASWLYRYMDNKKAKAVGLGSYPGVTLQAARDKAQALREARASHIDPAEFKQQEQARLKNQKVKQAQTFAHAATAYIAHQRDAWKNAKHAQQWHNTLAQYAFPVIGTLSVAAITADHIVEILSPLWADKHETASRLRGRIEKVLGWAAVNGMRPEGDNPARFQGLLEHRLPRVQKKVRHHPAMPYQELPAFMQQLRASQSGVSASALEFLILTACRTNEVCAAQWSEVDFDKKLWSIPAQRMKAGIEHRVPLSDRAIAILQQLKPFSGKQHIFISGRQDKPLSNMVLAMQLRRLGMGHYTSHGMRSTFRDWAGEQSHYPFDVCEQALAHRLPDKVAAAYLRTDFFTQRIGLMRDWADFCASSAEDQGPSQRMPTASTV